MYKNSIIASVLMMSVSPMAFADSFTLNGDTTGLATWNRAIGAGPSLSGVGNNVPFQTFEVTVTDSAAFEATTTSASFDTYLHVYSGSFDPIDQFTNIIAGNDDGGVGLLSSITGPIPEGQYIVVVSGYRNSSFGTFALFLDGVLLGFGPSTAQQLDELKASLTQVGRQTVRVLTGNVKAAVTDSIANRNFTISSKNEPAKALLGNIYAWAKASNAYTENNGHSVNSPTLQFGADVEVGSNNILGLSVGYGDLRQRSGATIIDGSQISIQPYFGWQRGDWQGTASVTYSDIDYDTITSASGTASAEGRLFALSAEASRGFTLKNGKTLSPFVSLSLGNIDLTQTAGSLAGAGLSNSVTFQDARFGTRLSQNVGVGIMTFGVSADYYHSNAPVNLVSGQFDTNGWSSTVEFGYKVAFTDGVNVNAQIDAGGLGSDSNYYVGSIEIGMQF
jgi:hypothetical protein